jgi:EF-P beta-lysylation protein EpmB
VSVTSKRIEETPVDGNWRESMRRAVRDPDELARLLELPAGTLTRETAAARAFPLLVPREFVARMRKGDADDPLLRQVLPTRAEGIPQPQFGPDPLAEHGLAINGCIQKYPGRALLITTGACPVHCRYCFRRAFPYAAQTAARDAWRPALETIASRAPVTEIILSGGDPLSLDNQRLAGLVAAIEALPGIGTLRIHTRFPVMVPARVDAGLVRLLEASRLNVVVVLHINHPAEIDGSVAGAAAALKRASGLLLNQAVLLAGVNDSVDTLIALGERLLDIGVAPYYLHLLDRVSGTAHFEVAPREARSLIASMRKRAPGYLVPRLVRDEAGQLSKTPVA